jgi:DnaJ-class molecular chaperone
MVKIKNVLEMDYYELLSVDRNSTPQEIERAYELCKSTYQSDSIAYHSLLSEEERQNVLDLVEKAYATLSDTKKRKAYDFQMYANKSGHKERAFFRKTTEKILIEDTTEKAGIWKRIKYFFLSPRKR